MTTTNTAAELLAHAAEAERNAAAQDAEAATMQRVVDQERTRLASALADRKRAHRMATRKDRPRGHALGHARRVHIDTVIIPAIEHAIAAAQADVDHLTADAARLRAVAADYRAQAAALTATPVTVTAPEAFIDWYADYGTSKITDADADATLTAARTAYRTAPAGERVKITTSDPRILDGLTAAAAAYATYTRECMDADPDSAGLLARDIRRAELFAERVTAARAELLAQPAQEAEEAPSAPQTAQERPAVDHTACEHRKSLTADHAPACPVYTDGLTAEHCTCHLSDAECERTTTTAPADPAALAAARLLEGLTVTRGTRPAVLNVTGHAVRPDGTVVLALAHLNGAAFTAPLDDTALTAADRATFAQRVKAHQPA